MAEKRPGCNLKCFIIAILIILIAVIALSMSYANTPACTEDAKICPDGTTVGRVAPDCEFAPCPNECRGDADCVPEQCCHPTSCTNKALKGVCNLACTASCEGPLDCGAGACACVKSKCVVMSNV
jgi:hypothetical protein